MKVHIWDNGGQYSDHVICFIRQGDFSDDDMARIFRAWQGWKYGDPKVLGVVDEAQLAPGTAGYIDDALDYFVGEIQFGRANDERASKAIAEMGEELALRLIAAAERDAKERHFVETRAKIQGQIEACPANWTGDRATLERRLRDLEAEELAWRAEQAAAVPADEFAERIRREHGATVMLKGAPPGPGLGGELTCCGHLLSEHQNDDGAMGPCAVSGCRCDPA